MSPSNKSTNGSLELSPVQKLFINDHELSEEDLKIKLISLINLYQTLYNKKVKAIYPQWIHTVNYIDRDKDKWELLDISLDYHTAS